MLMLTPKKRGPGNEGVVTVEDVNWTWSVDEI
jgi:hypothetical protein